MQIIYKYFYYFSAFLACTATVITFIFSESTCTWFTRCHGYSANTWAFYEHGWAKRTKFHRLTLSFFFIFCPHTTLSNAFKTALQFVSSEIVEPIVSLHVVSVFISLTNKHAHNQSHGWWESSSEGRMIIDYHVMSQDGSRNDFAFGCHWRILSWILAI